MTILICSNDDYFDPDLFYGKVKHLYGENCEKVIEWKKFTATGQSYNYDCPRYKLGAMSNLGVWRASVEFFSLSMFRLYCYLGNRNLDRVELLLREEIAFSVA